jgi:hypothetical protein
VAARDYFDHIGHTITWEVVDFPTPIEILASAVWSAEERELTDEEIEHFRKAVAERYQREGCL